MELRLKLALVSAIDCYFPAIEMAAEFMFEKSQDHYIFEIKDSTSKKSVIKAFIEYLLLEGNSSSVKQMAEYICDNENYTQFEGLNNKEMLIERCKSSRQELIDMMMKTYMR